jgi:hypothetical protein
MNAEPLRTHCLAGFDEPHITKETVYTPALRANAFEIESVARLVLPQAYEQKQKTLPQAAGYRFRGTRPSKRLRRSILHSTGRAKPQEGTPKKCEKAQRSNHLIVSRILLEEKGKALRHGKTAEKSLLNDRHEWANGRRKNFCHSALPDARRRSHTRLQPRRRILSEDRGSRGGARRLDRRPCASCFT